MFLSEPPESPYDLSFSLMGIRVRVAWTFWLVAVIFGYNGAILIDNLFYTTSPGILPWLAIWCGVMFTSILLHELGHVLAFRACGIDASIVLYHFGGLAIPGGQRAPGNFFARLTPWQGIFVAAAGPGIQLLLAAAVILVVKLAGYGLYGGAEEMIEQGRYFPMQPQFLLRLPGMLGGAPITDPGIYSLVDFALFVNVMWALLNLVPVWPLDGGRIAREVIELCGGTVAHALQLSMLSGGGLALWFLANGHLFAGILFASLAISSFQLLSAMGGGRF